MKKLLALGIVLVALLAFVGAVSADSTLDLVQKDPDHNWIPVTGGGSGTLTYPLDELTFTSFDGLGLTGGVEYSLISYAETGTGSTLLGTGTANEFGIIHIAGGPMNLVQNTYAPDAPGDYQGVTGAKIWLVPSSDFNAVAGSLNWAHYATYLYETRLLIRDVVPTPEFPSIALPAALIIGLVGLVFFIRKSKE